MRKYLHMLLVIALGLCMAACQPQKEDIHEETFPELMYGDGENQVLDLYTTNAEDLRPLIVLVHGGSFISGDKAEGAVARIRDYFKDQGYVVASVNYTMETGTYPQAIIDIKQALAFLVDHAASYHIDSEKIILWGEGTGAYLAAVAAMSSGDRFKANKSDLDYTYHVNTLIDYYGPLDHPRIEDHNITRWRNGKEPKSLKTYVDDMTLQHLWIAHGSQDAVVSSQHATHFISYVKDKVQDIHYEKKDTSGHEDEAFFSEAYFQEIDQFLKSIE